MGADRTATLTGIAVLLVLATAAASPADAVDTQDLVFGEWRLETPLGRVAGPCLVILDSEANWRCEIAVAEDGTWPSRGDLLHRSGRGWTISATADGGYVQPWSEPWRQLGPAAVAAFAALLREWTGGDAAPPRRPVPHRWSLREDPRPAPITLDDWAGLPDAWRPPGEGVSSGGELRRRLTTRGRGRGGDGLVLDLRWKHGELVATSARWPGRVSLGGTRAEVVSVPFEAFLPLWPLAEFVP